MKSKYLIVSSLSFLLLAGCSGNSPSTSGDQKDNSKTPVTQVITQTVTQQVPGQTQTQPLADGKSTLPSLSQVTLPPSPVTTQLKWKSYTDSANGFTLSYPEGYVTSSQKVKNKVFQINFPDSFKKGTNLSDAYLYIMSYKDDGKCLTSGFDNSKLSKTVKNNGVTYYIDNWQEGAAGNVGKNFGYNTVYKGICYKFDLTEFYTNMNMYSDGKGGYVAGAPKEFNESEILSIFKQIFSTFKLTK